MTVVDLRPATVGGSECAAAAGVHPFVSPVMLWAQKTGRLPVAETEAMRWGTRLEPVIELALAADGWQFVTLASIASVIAPGLPPWFAAHPDAFVLLAGRPAVLEIKTANQWAHGDGDVPVQYQAQCQWYMHATGLEHAVVATLVAGQRLEIRTVAYDGRAVELLLAACERFVWHLTTDTPPPPDGSSSTRDALLGLHPSAQAGRTVRLLGDDWQALRDLRALKAQRDRLDLLIGERENQVKAAMGDAERAISPHDDEVARWSNTTARRVDTTELRRQRPDLADMFTVETTTRRFTVR